MASDTVLQPAERDALTPAQVETRLRAGNQRFVSGSPAERDWRAQVRAAATGQAPMAAVLSCIDSRVPVETVFDCGIGELAVARVAGNCVHPDVLGGLEFAVAGLGARLVLVLGHGSCGAVAGTIDGADLESLRGTLDLIGRAVDAVADTPGERSSSNRDLLSRAIEHNVQLGLQDLRAQSPLLAQQEANGQLAIRGALYDMNTGTVDFLD